MNTSSSGLRKLRDTRATPGSENCVSPFAHPWPLKWPVSISRNRRRATIIRWLPPLGLSPSLFSTSATERDDRVIGSNNSFVYLDFLIPITSGRVNSVQFP